MANCSLANVAGDPFLDLDLLGLFHGFALCSIELTPRHFHPLGHTFCYEFAGVFDNGPPLCLRCRLRQHHAEDQVLVVLSGEIVHR